MNGPQDVLAGTLSLPLFGLAATRQLETTDSAAPSLMDRAGLSVAKLALATSPDARRIVVAVGPGNNGGDGLVAARHLHQCGKNVVAVLTRNGADMPADARIAFNAAVQAGVTVTASAWPAERPCLVIDALLGIGARGDPRGRLAQVWRDAERCAAPRLAVDVPSGLDAELGVGHASPTWPALEAQHTLSLLTLKPGLFTGIGRDACGRIWFDDLGVDALGIEPIARLSGPALRSQRAATRHAQHKGSLGDVTVVGGSPGMQGALLLAASAALAAGAGRVHAVPLGSCRSGQAHSSGHPELMWRSMDWLADRQTLEHSTVVCGCGAGTHAAQVLPGLLSVVPRLVIDADGLNALAADSALLSLLRQRAPRGMATVLTPHPLEAARLLGQPDARAVQLNRLGSARELASRTGTVVVLKGAGTIIDNTQDVPWINPSGNALLATAGTGDVLAGWIAGRWSRGRKEATDTRALTSLVAGAVWDHGHAADCAAQDGQTTMSASALIGRLSKC